MKHLELQSKSPASSVHALERLPEEWRALVEQWGERAYRGDQIFRWLHDKGVCDPNQMTNLSKALRARLGDLNMAWPGEVSQVLRSEDGTRKLLIELRGGGRVKCVLIPMTKSPGDQLEEEDDERLFEEERPLTLCISSQHGCAMGCKFCASGQAGLLRGLSTSEIVMQIVFARRHVEPGERLRNLVFMGMGEPLHHYERTALALRLITHPDGLGIGPRRITVSTVGLIPGIRRLGEDFQGKIGLAISLHAPTDEIRNRIIPMNAKYPLKELLQTLKKYPIRRRRRITIEYTLISGVNDSVEHASELASLLRGLPVKVNLIPMNPIEAADYRAPSADQVKRFREVMAERGYSCFVRTTRGDDVAAACGQLALQKAEARLAEV